MRHLLLHDQRNRRQFTEETLQNMQESFPRRLPIQGSYPRASVANMIMMIPVTVV